MKVKYVIHEPYNTATYIDNDTLYSAYMLHQQEYDPDLLPLCNITFIDTTIKRKFTLIDFRFIVGHVYVILLIIDENNKKHVVKTLLPKNLLQDILKE